MDDFLTCCRFPGLCEECHLAVEINLLEKPKPKCPHCRSTKVVPYDDPSLSKTPGRQRVTSWNESEQLGRELVLTNGKYKCPKCGKMALTFEDGDVFFD